MRIKRTAMAWVAAATLSVSLATPALSASADGTPDQPAGQVGAAGQALLTAEKDAASGVDAKTQKQVQALQARVARHVEKHGTKDTFGTYADAVTGKIVLQTDASADVVAGLLGPELTGSKKVVVKRQELKDSYSRRNDIPSYWGGAGVTNGSGICSTGFTVQNGSGTRFQVTAGHCFTNGTNTYTELGGRWMGVVSNNAVNDWWNRHDMELIGGSSYAWRIYTGGVDSSSSLPIVGSGDPVVGYSDYCHSGRTTGEHCGHTVNSTSAQVCTQSGCKSPVIAYTGGVMIQPGDSGSPFFVKNSTSAWARGINIASGGGTGYAEKWSRIQSRLGVSIVTG